MILVGSKADLEDERKITKKQGYELADQYELQFVQTSAKDNQNIAHVFNILTADVIKRLTAEDKIKEVTKGSATATLNNKVEK